MPLWLRQLRTRKGIKMPAGKGTYGNKVGRPSQKKVKKAMGTAAKSMAKKGMGTAGKLTAKQKKLPDFLKEKILKSKKK